MKSIEINPEAVSEAAASLPPDGPICMVNLLRYRDRADYAAGGDLPACSGREAYYGRYVPAFFKVAADPAIKPLWVGNAHAALAAPPGERWDDVALVEYPSFATFRQLVESPEYLAEAAPHRLAALEDCPGINPFMTQRES